MINSKFFCVLLGLQRKGRGFKETFMLPKRGACLQGGLNTGFTVTTYVYFLMHYFCSYGGGGGN